MSDLTIQRTALSSDAALRLIAAAVHHSASIDKAMTIAVVDDAGDLKGFVRMDGAYKGSVQIAQDKAYSAVLMMRPTGAWPQILDSDPVLAAGLPRATDRLVTFGGGVPVVVGGVIVGAIGVSGGHYTQDTEVAEAAIAAVFGAAT